MLIGLIRHGLTDWNAIGKIQGQSDIPLNDEGRMQAAMLADRLLQEPYSWDYCVTSNLSRAAETGKIIADKLGIPLLEPDQRIRERAYGQVEGLTAAEREEKWGRNGASSPSVKKPTNSFRLGLLLLWKIFLHCIPIGIYSSYRMEDFLLSCILLFTRISILNELAIYP